MLEKKRIKKVVTDGIQEILNKYNIDWSSQEIGHKYGERVEDDVISLLKNSGFVVVEKSGPRSMEDLAISKKFINVKFGVKYGQPNIVSLQKLIKHIAKGEDQYWILKIKVINENPIVRFFDILDYPDYLTYDCGTGQTMLSEKKLEEDWEEIKDRSPLSIEDKMENLYSLFTVKYENLIKLRKKRYEEIKTIYEEFMKNVSS